MSVESSVETNKNAPGRKIYHRKKSVTFLYSIISSFVFTLDLSFLSRGQNIFVFNYVSEYIM